MNQSHMVHYAVACLEGLEFPTTPRDLSRSQRIPLEECRHILRQFEAAGLVRESGDECYERTCSVEQVTALEVLQALWSAVSRKAIRMLFGHRFEADQTTRLVSHTSVWPRG
jgi:hypothetical protein